MVSLPSLPGAPLGVPLAVAPSVAKGVSAGSLSGGTPPPVPTSIGGVPFGFVAISGPETGMKMVVGDDFDGPLDLYGPAPENRFGRYGTDRANYIIEADFQSLRSAEKLGGVDGDPYWTGHLDSNRGRPIASMADLITQSGGKLTLKQRPMVAGEAAHVLRNNKDTMSSMIHTALYAFVRAPGVMEWEEQRFVHPKAHPTGWGMQRINGTDGDNETDIEAASHQDGTGDGRQIEYNNNVWVGRGRSASRSSGSAAFTVDWSTPHRFKIAYTDAGNVEYYQDDVLQSTQNPAELGKTLAEAYHQVFTMHMYNVDGRTGEDRYVISWWRMWAKNGLVAPKQNHILIQVAAGEARTVAMPTQTALWGRVVTEDIQALMPQPGEPGGTTNGVLYTDTPPGCDIDKTISDTPKIVLANTLKPGRFTIGRYVKEPGYVSIVHRYVVEIGPEINVPDFTVTQGVDFNWDIYPLVNCGSLVTANGTRAKTIVVTGLPAGLRFENDAIIGNSTAATGERIIRITGTNSVGQSVSKDVKLNLVAKPVDNVYEYQALASLVGDFDASRDASFAAQTGEISSWGNAVSGKGDLSQPSTITAKAQRFASVLNGRSTVRLVRGADAASSTVLESAAGAPVASVMSGTDSNWTLVTLVRPNAALTGSIAGWSEQIDGTSARNVGTVRRSPTVTSAPTSSLRMGNTTQTTSNIDVGQIPEGAFTLAVARHAAGVSDYWKGKTKVVDAVAHTSTTIWSSGPSLARFGIGNLQGGTNSATRYPGTAFDGDVAQVIAFNAALTDAQITQLMNDLYAKWGLT